MRLIDRYIGRQLLVTAVFAVFVLTILLVLGTIFKKLLEVLINQNTSLKTVIGIILWVLPFSLTYSIPWGFLTSVLLVFGRLSSENELTALRTSGVSLPRLCVPVAVLAVIFTTICLWINLYIAPKAQEQTRNAALEILKSNPLAIFGSDRVIEDFPNKKVFVGESHGDQLKNIYIYQLDPADGSLMNTSFAREGRLSVEDAPDEANANPSGEKEKVIMLKFFKFRYEGRDQNPKWKDDISHWLRGITIDEGKSFVSLRELYEKKKKAQTHSSMDLEQLLKSEGGKPGEVMVEVNKRISNAMATIVFALLAVPLAVGAQRKETSIGFVIALAVGLTYFLLFFIVDSTRHKPHLYPQLLIWLPNVIFLLVGGPLFLRLARR